MKQIAHLVLIFSLLMTPLIAKEGVSADEHWEHAPENPDFSYETRFIPGYKDKENITSDIKPEVIVEKIDNTQKQQNKVKVNIYQIAIIVAIVILFILYRRQILKRKRIH